MKRFEAFNKIKTNEDLERFFNLEEGEVESLLRQLRKNKAYQLFFVPKKNGGMRVIKAPNSALKSFQRQVNEWLMSAYQVYVPHCAQGFIPKKSIVTNAAQHTKKKWVLNFDLADFYGSISREQVCRLLQRKPFCCSPRIASILTVLCTTRTGLPQGAPTSPTLSNILAYGLDQKFMKLAKIRYLTYTRYADDITFSANYPFGTDLVLPSMERDNAMSVGQTITKIVEDCGFKINPDKTRLQSHNQAQIVTGLKVNTRVNVNRKRIREVRAMIHAYNTYGSKAIERFYDKYHKYRHWPDRQEDCVLTDKNFSDVIAGKLSFIKMVKGKQDPVYQKLNSAFNAMLKRMRENGDTVGSWSLSQGYGNAS